MHIRLMPVCVHASEDWRTETLDRGTCRRIKSRIHNVVRGHERRIVEHGCLVPAHCGRIKVDSVTRSDGRLASLEWIPGDADAGAKGLVVLPGNSSSKARVLPSDDDSVQGITRWRQNIWIGARACLNSKISRARINLLCRGQLERCRVEICQVPVGIGRLTKQRPAHAVRNCEIGAKMECILAIDFKFILPNHCSEIL